MGKIILEFDGIEERSDMEDALNGVKWKMIVWDMDQELRRIIKYDDTISEDTYEIVEKLREYLRENIIDRGVSLDD